MTDDVVPSRRGLRRMLEAVLPTDADLDAFCADYFPGTKRRFSAGMNRMAKVTELLEVEDGQEILHCLSKTDGKRANRFRHLLLDQPTAPGVPEPAVVPVPSVPTVPRESQPVSTFRVWMSGWQEWLFVWLRVFRPRRSMLLGVGATVAIGAALVFHQLRPSGRSVVTIQTLDGQAIDTRSREAIAGVIGAELRRSECYREAIEQSRNTVLRAQVELWIAEEGQVRGLPVILPAESLKERDVSCIQELLRGIDFPKEHIPAQLKVRYPLGP